MLYFCFLSVQLSSVAQSCLTLYDPMNCSTPSLPVHHQLPEFTQTHVHWVSDAIQPSHLLSSPSPPALNLSQHQIRSDQISRSVLSYSLWPHESQHARPPCPSPTPGVHWDSHPSSQWCHPASGSSQMSQLFTSGGQSTGVSASESVL